MVFRDRGYPQSTGLGYEVKDSVSLMPASLIHPELYHDFLVAAEDRRERAKKSIGISPVLAHDSVPTAQRVHPAEHIESFMMLTLGHYEWLSSLLAPPPCPSWDEGKIPIHPRTAASFFLRFS